MTTMTIGIYTNGKRIASIHSDDANCEYMARQLDKGYTFGSDYEHAVNPLGIAMSTFIIEWYRKSSQYKRNNPIEVCVFKTPDDGKLTFVEKFIAYKMGKMVAVHMVGTSTYY